MAKERIVPCVWMDDQAEEAAAFYSSVFSSGKPLGTSHYPEEGSNPSGKAPGSVVTVEVDIEGQRFTLLNGGPQFRPNPSVSFFVSTGSAAEVDRLHAALAQGGQDLMPLGTYPWSERYAWVQDRFGVSWQIMAERKPGEAALAPCLMFSGVVGGRAREAMEMYVKILGGEVEAAAPYEEGEGPAGWVKHGRFRLGDQQFVAMDAPGEHAFRFGEGISLQVLCGDQPTIDRLWAALSAGGEAGVCGWLSDRFGVRWQITPAALDKWMTSRDVAAKDRAFAALMKMKKIDIATLERAYQGA